MIESAYQESLDSCIVACTAQLHALLTKHPQLDHIHVAYSGGMDSHILLLIAQQAFKTIKSDHAFSTRKLELSAIHINHQLSEYSNQWQQHCEQVCAELEIPLICESVEVATDEGFSLEEQARIQRYRVFEKYLGDSGLLLMAHHLDDQMETMLMRLLKGAGPTGLAGIPKQRLINESVNGSILFRPLLDISRQQLLEFATLKKLKWIEDPSNSSITHDRNYLRHSVLPLLEQRWPGYRKTWSRTAGVFSEYAQLADQVAAQDYLYATGSELSQLRLKPLLELDRFRQKNLIRHWLNLNGCNNPEHGWVETILDEVAMAAEDAAPIFETTGWQIRRFNGFLYLLDSQQFGSQLEFDGSKSFQWDLNGPLILPGSGILVVDTASPGFGLSLRKPQDEQISIRFRQGGERCRPVGRSGSRSLKKLLNEYKVEPWLRDRVPLIYFGNELAAVLNCFVCESFQAVDIGQAIQLRWSRNN
ncbi:MAG: tRNA lysidine(34) synthetase TilS [Pseudomonadales bacterium]|nr:tRNA lysidine(34) synthetase TilS [Pseudomonadales bacterium]